MDLNTKVLLEVISDEIDRAYRDYCFLVRNGFSEEDVELSRAEYVSLCKLWRRIMGVDYGEGDLYDE